MIALTFPIYLQEPLLATTLAGDPNSSVSLPFIPGSLLRGALVAQYLREHPDADIATDPKLRALFLDGKTRYLNAYPLDARGRATLPTPAAWHQAKGESEKSPVYDLSVELQDDEDWQPQAVKSPFCQLKEAEVTFYTPDRQMNVHTQRDRVMGRAIEDSGAVFRYEALAAGQSFGGVVLCDNEEAAKTLESLLEAALFLGGSHNAGYGRVEIGAIKRADSWQEVPLKPADVKSGSKLTITLLSDALLRDANGQYTPFLTAEWLGARLGVTLTPEQEHTFAKSVIIGGFNRKWGLPLPQTQAARAGSVYTFTTDADIPAKRLAELITEGIGERRVEGFGRLTINWHTQHEELMPQDPPQPDKLKADPLTGESEVQAQRIAERMLRRKLDQRLIERVNGLEIKSPPANSQLSQISVLIRSALPGKDVTAIIERLDTMKKKAKDQFEAARIENQSLLEWIKQHITESREQVWRWLYPSSYREDDLPAVGKVRANWTDDLAREYALRLVDGVLHRAITKRREEE